MSSVNSHHHLGASSFSSGEDPVVQWGKRELSQLPSPEYQFDTFNGNTGKSEESGGSWLWFGAKVAAVAIGLTAFVATKKNVSKVLSTEFAKQFFSNIINPSAWIKGGKIMWDAVKSPDQRAALLKKIQSKASEWKKGAEKAASSEVKPARKIKLRSADQIKERAARVLRKSCNKKDSTGGKKLRIQIY